MLAIKARPAQAVTRVRGLRQPQRFWAALEPYARLPIADHLQLGARLDPGWDGQLAHSRVEALGRLM